MVRTIPEREPFVSRFDEQDSTGFPMLSFRQTLLRSLTRSLCCSGVMALSFSLMLTGEVHAQSLFGSSGALSSTASSNGGGRSSAGGMTGGSSSGTSGFGSGSGSGSRSGTMGTSGGGSSGNAAGGAMGGGQSSLTQSSLNTGDGSLGATVGTSGFVGRGDTAGRFVGSQNASRQQVVGGAQQFSALQNRNNQNANTNSTPPRQLLRPQVQLGFESPLVMAPPVAETVYARIADLPAIGSRVAGVNMQLDPSGVMVLSGTVASENDRRMLEILTSMEPGVRSVRNEVQVAP